MLDRIRFVLSHPSHPGNIGATARAMKAMGLGRLYLVAPKRFPDAEAIALASGADDVLDAAIVCDSLDTALADVGTAFALTARRRDLAQPSVDVREAAMAGLSEATTGEVAFVFGNEMTGLSNDEVLRCRRIVHIPVNPRFSSLNLAQAVQIVAHELHFAESGGAIPQPAPQPAATDAEVENFHRHLESAIVQSGFLDPANPRRMMERLRRLFGRVRLEKVEIDILRGIIAAFENPRPPRR